MTRYTGTLVAPYWQFRRTVKGLAADIMGCHWTCDGCWAHYGWWGLRPRHELDPQGVLTRVFDYDVRDLLITGGEPGYYWSHIVDVARLCAHEGHAFTVETAGVIVGPPELDLLDEAVGSRGAVVIGVKATTPEELARLTGLPLAVAARQHDRQMRAVEHAAHHTRLHTMATFLDAYASRESVIATYRSGVEVDVLPFRSGSNYRIYRPKRHRRRTAR